MDVAKCTLDDVVFNAHDFSLLPSAELGRKRRFLVCSECKGPAFFRKASRSGQAACFGARPHADGCSLAAPEHEQHDDEFGEDQDALNNPGQLIHVDFNFGGAGQNIAGTDANPRDNSARRGRFTGDGPRQEAMMHRRLSTLLRNLITSEQFRSSDQILEISGRGNFVVRNFFKEFSDIQAGNIGIYGGYWGFVTYAKTDNNGTLWFNSGGIEDVSTLLDEQYVDDIFKRYHIDDEEAFAGAYILVFGTLQLSARGKKFIKIEDPGFFVLKLSA